VLGKFTLFFSLIDNWKLAKYGDDMKITRIAVFAVLLFLAGCSGQRFTVQSSPPGASIVEIQTGKNFGIAPVALYNNPSSDSRKNADGCTIISGFEARWPSGATGKTGRYLEVCGSSKNTFVITRDRSSPGFDADVINGIAEEKSREYKREQDEVQSTKAIEAYSDIANSAIDTIIEAKRLKSTHSPRPETPVHDHQYDTPTQPSGCTYRTYSVTTGMKTQFCTQDNSCNVFCY
jgi:hypothetical protein